MFEYHSNAINKELEGHLHTMQDNYQESYDDGIAANPGNAGADACIKCRRNERREKGTSTMQDNRQTLAREHRYANAKRTERRIRPIGLGGNRVRQTALTDATL